MKLWLYRLPETKPDAKSSIQTNCGTHLNLLHVQVEDLSHQCGHFQQLKTEGFKKVFLSNMTYIYSPQSPTSLQCRFSSTTELLLLFF